MVNAGMSKCPVCKREWLVTPLDDCMLPACGCYGHDTSENNPNRICHSCGMNHTKTCLKMESCSPQFMEPVQHPATQKAQNG